MQGFGTFLATQDLGRRCNLQKKERGLKTYPIKLTYTKSIRVYTHLKCVNVLTLSIQAFVFTFLQLKSFENTLGKGEIARHEQFLLFPQCFLPIWRTFCYFYQIRNCGLQTLSVRKSLKSVIRERVKQFLFLTFAFSKIVYTFLY